MQFSVLPLAVAIAVLMFATTAAANGVSCGDTISSSTNLTDNLTCSGSGLTIGAENMTLDCAGHSITGDGSPGDGIDNAGYDNVTVKNCIISGFNNESSSNYNTGIHYYNEANNGSIINNTINSNLEGIFLNSSSGNNITGNIANDNAYQGILLIGSNNNTITNNIAINSTTGIYLGSTSGCSYNTITYNNISNSSQNGISLDTNSNGNIIENNKVSYSSNAGIGLWSGSTSNIINFNQIYNNTNYDAYQENGGNDFTLNYWGGFLCNAKLSGITSTNDLAPYYMDEALTALQNTSFCCGETVDTNYTLVGDLACSGGGNGVIIGADTITLDCAGHSITGDSDGTDNFGVFIHDFENVTVQNCDIIGFNSSEEGGIYVEGSNTTIIDSNISGDYAIYIFNSSDNRIIGSAVHGITSGLYLESSSNNTITGSGISGDYAFYLASSGYNNITQSTITGNTAGAYFESASNNRITHSNMTGDYAVYLTSSSDNITVSNSSISATTKSIDVESGSGNFTYNYWGTYLCSAKVAGIDNLSDLLPFYADAAMTTLDSGPLDCICGQTITENKTLAHDYVCIEGGIIIGADNITLDCAGHSMTGGTSGLGIGITTFSGATIKNCRIFGFEKAIYSENSHDDVIHNNTFISPNNYGIHLYNTGYSSITGNNISDALANGIFVEANTGPLSHNLVQGNTITISETPLGGWALHGIRIGDDNNSIYNNTIDCQGKNLEQEGILIYTQGGANPADDNTLSGNEVYNCQYGLHAQNVLHFEVDDDKYHNDTYGVYMSGVGSSSPMPLIENSRIYDNNHGVYLTMGSYANISNTNFTNNPGAEGKGPASGIHVQGGSTAYVTNGRFIDNGEYGIYDIVLNDHVYWTINGNALCRNNGAKINGSITFDGGKLELDNCTLFLNGAEISINGNITSLDQAQAEVEANTTSGELNFTASNASITLNLAENVTATVIVLPVTPNASGTTASLTALKGIEITVDNATRGNLTWALIKIFYNESELTAANINESTLKIYYYNTTATAWQLEPNQGVDTVNNYVWANVTHFSMFGAFGSALIVALAPSGGVGGSVYQLANTSTFQMFSGDTVRFAAGSQNHSALLLHVYSSYVTMRISSDSFDINISANAIQKVDVDNDSIYDLAMTLKNVTGTKATIQFEKISEPVPAAAPLTPPPAAPPAAPPTGAVITPEVNITAPAVLPTNITAPTVPPAATPIILPRALIIELLFIAAIAAALLVAVRSTHRKYKAHRGHTHPWYRGQGAVPAKLVK